MKTTDTETKRGRGRGRPATGDAFRHQYPLRCSKEEHAIMAQAAAQEGKAWGTWLRELGLARARKKL